MLLARGYMFAESANSPEIPPALSPVPSRLHPGDSCGILGRVRSPLETFAGLLDRSVQEIAASAADARTVDLSRISLIADIWDNNTFSLVSAACAPRLVRTGRARAGLRWMAGLGAARRELMADLDPALDTVLPAALPGAAAYRDYRGRVRPGSFPVTTQIAVGLETDYALSAASLRSLDIRPARTGRCAGLTLAAPRRFAPGTGRTARDGTRRPWPPALLAFTFTDVGELAFDAGDRTGAAITVAAGASLAIGRSGHLRAASAAVHPDDPCWHEAAQPARALRANAGRDENRYRRRPWPGRSGPPPGPSFT